MSNKKKEKAMMKHGNKLMRLAVLKKRAKQWGLCEKVGPVILKATRKQLMEIWQMKCDNDVANTLIWLESRGWLECGYKDTKAGRRRDGTYLLGHRRPASWIKDKSGKRIRVSAQVVWLAGRVLDEDAT